MYKFEDIKIIQLEISNFCNAACPQCPRNYFGGKTIPTLPMRKWTLDEFKRIFSAELLNNIQQIYFCGTYGDPLTNRHLVTMCKFLKECNSQIKIGIHTNGGVGNVDTYRQLAAYSDFIAFGIDGLEDTNHLYRRKTNWNKIINNAKSYISAGGTAIWDFIVFKHNQHQIQEAQKLSQTLGFKSFNIKKTSRFLNRNHVYNDTLAVYNQDGFIDYAISIPTIPEYINEGYQTIPIVSNTNNCQSYAKNAKVNCNANRIKEIYIAADGFVFPCGWLHDRLYGPEVELNQDHVILKQLMANAGGWTVANIFHTPLSTIVNGAWFSEIFNSWGSNQQLERCGIMCGNEVNLIGPQNKDIGYKL